MSFTSAAGADIVREAGGVTYRFRRPTRAQVAQQIAAWASEDGAVLRRLLDECKVEGEKRFEILREHERRARLLSYGLACAFEFKRSGDIIRTACGAEPESLPFSSDELTEVAAELWGIKPEKAGPRPLGGSAAAQTASPTGGSSTPGSGAGSDATPTG